MKSSALKSTTDPDICTENDDASNDVIFLMPLTPFLILSQALVTVDPTGETKPNPVTTTRLVFSVILNL